MKVKVLCDTGAEVSLLMSPKTAKRAAAKFNAKLIKLRRPIQLADYRQQKAGLISYKIILHFELDGRRFTDQEFLVTETGYDVFIGNDWLNEQDVWIHPRSKSFSWPETTLPLAQFSPALVVRKNDTKVDRVSQADADRRDRLIEQ